MRRSASRQSTFCPVWRVPNRSTGGRSNGFEFSDEEDGVEGFEVVFERFIGGYWTLLLEFEVGLDGIFLVVVEWG